jgi:hypothetical protein
MKWTTGEIRALDAEFEARKIACCRFDRGVRSTIADLPGQTAVTERFPCRYTGTIGG